ncbi:unnamed protein product, partial [Brassica oleracea var. botrytis]
QICLNLACFQIGAPDSQDQRLDDVFSKLHALYLYCWCFWLRFVSILALACLSSLTLAKVLRFRFLSSLQSLDCAVSGLNGIERSVLVLRS